MIIDYIEIRKLPVLIIDDFFTEEESNLILEELVQIHDYFLKDPSKTGSGKYDDVDKKSGYKKNASGLFLDEFYLDRRQDSNILKINRKLFDKNLVSLFTNFHYFFKYLLDSNHDKTLAHYYENNDFYDFHSDRTTVSAISWHYFEPKRFSGGNLILDKEYKVSVECLNKRIVIFSSILDHLVEHVSMEKQFENMKLGRFSIAQFANLF